jgi:CDP-glucose 4,6-dehydratase
MKRRGEFGIVNSAKNKFWKGRNVFVTGATGLVGMWLTRKLTKLGARVFCLVVPTSDVPEHVWEDLDHSPEQIQGDICDQKLIQATLQKHKIDTVFHLAAQPIVGAANQIPVPTFEVNIQGTWTLLEACRNHAGVKQIVVASSDKAYGEHKKLPYLEETPLKGLHPYDVSKSCADLITQTYAKTYDLPVGLTRCCNLYGGGDLHWSRIIPGTIRSIQQGEVPIIRSDGKMVRDYLYVEDAVAGYLLLAEKLSEELNLKGEAFNFSSGEKLSVFQVVEKTLKLMNSHLKPIVENKVKNEIKDQYLSASKAKRKLGWKPHLSLESGLLKTVQWYQEYFKREERQLADLSV